MKKDINHLFIVKKNISNEHKELLTKALKDALGENETLIVFGEVEYFNLKKL